MILPQPPQTPYSTFPPLFVRRRGARPRATALLHLKPVVSAHSSNASVSAFADIASANLASAVCSVGPCQLHMNRSLSPAAHAALVSATHRFDRLRIWTQLLLNWVGKRGLRRWVVATVESLQNPSTLASMITLTITDSTDDPSAHRNFRHPNPHPRLQHVLVCTRAYA